MGVAANYSRGMTTVTSNREGGWQRRSATPRVSDYTIAAVTVLVFSQAVRHVFSAGGATPEVSLSGLN